MKKIKIAIAGIGNSTSSLVQGIEFYRNKSEKDSIRVHSSEGYESLGYAVSQKSIYSLGRIHPVFLSPLSP